MMNKASILLASILLSILLIPTHQANAQLSTISTGADPFVNALGPNGIVYVAGYTCSCVKIHDFSDKYNPTTLATISTDTNPDFIVATSTYAYVGASGKIDVFDMSNPSSPSQVDTYSLPGGTNSNKMRIVGQNLFVNFSGNPGGILILSLANPAHPTLVSQTNFTGVSGVGDVLPVGNYMYVADYFGRTLKVYDISNLSSPQLRQSILARNESALSYKTFATDFEPWRLVTKGNTLYVLDDDILEMYNISSSTNMVYVRSITTARDTEGAEISGNFIYFAGSGAGGPAWKVLQIYNIASTTNPLLVSEFNTGKNNYWISIDSNGYYYVNAATENQISAFAPLESVVVSSPNMTLIESATSSFTVRLASQPASNVTVNIATTTPGTGSGATVSTSSIVFTTNDWNTPRTVIVTALNDSANSGSRTVTIHFTSSSADSAFNNLTLSDSSVAIAEDDIPAGVHVDPTSLSLPEDFTSGFSVSLDRQPTSNVTLTFATTSPSEGPGATIFPPWIIFAPNNYSNPVAITVQTFNDTTYHGEQAMNVQFSLESADTNYNNLSAPNLPITISDDDPGPGVDISATDLDLIEGSSNNFSIQLIAIQPTSDVTVNFSVTAPDTGPGVTLSTSSIVFTTEDWNTPRTVTINALDDEQYTGYRTVSVTPTLVSGDPHYNNLIALSVSANIQEDEPAPPTVETEPYVFNSSNPTLTGRITDIGGQNSTERGFVYGPTAAYGATSSSQGDFSEGLFYQTISYIAPGATIHYAAFAKNVSGTSYGGDQTFTVANPSILITSPTANQVVTNWSPSVSWHNDGGDHTSCQYSYGEQSQWNTSNGWDGSYTFDGSSDDWSSDNNWGGNHNWNEDWTGTWTDADCEGSGSEIAPPETYDTWTLALRSTAEHSISVALTTFAYSQAPVSTPPTNNNTSPEVTSRSGSVSSSFPSLLQFFKMPPNPVTSPPITVSTFTRDLTIGSLSNDVKNLQIYLNSKGYIVAPIGPGSKGNETKLFGGLTRAALVKFQKANRISPAIGYFGPITRAFIALHW